MLKDILTSISMLTLLEGTKSFVVYRDASQVGLGCVVTQHGKVISYASSQPKVRETQYQTCDLELVTMVFA